MFNISRMVDWLVRQSPMQEVSGSNPALPDIFFIFFLFKNFKETNNISTVNNTTVSEMIFLFREKFHKSVFQYTLVS